MGAQKGLPHKSPLFKRQKFWDDVYGLADSMQEARAQSELFVRVKGKPFWNWEEGEQHKADSELKPTCCFNHIIGLPEKNGRVHPMYDYEKMLYDALMQRKGDDTDKHNWLKKATGMGATAFYLRFMVWLATWNDELAGSTMCIVTGPNEALAMDLVDRVRKLFVVNFPEVSFVVDSAKKIEINKVTFQAYPSNHLDAMRGIANCSFIFMDEAAFFGKQEQDTENPRTIAERYVGKSNPYIVMCSTPNLEDDIFGSIEFEKNPIYTRRFLHYSLGVGKIYAPEEIERAKSTPSFRREYELEYLGVFGNLFKAESIALAEQQGLQCESVVKNEIRQDTKKSMGVDAGFSSSAFGIVITQYNEQNHKIEVLYAEEFERPDFNEMIDHIVKLKYNYLVDKIYVDAANVPVVTSLKKIVGERTDYHTELLKIKNKHPPDPARWMDVIPVAFNPEGRDMLIATYMMLDRGWLSIHPKFSKLLISLRTATSREGMLLKDKTAHDDVLDALRLSLKMYNIPQSQ